MDWSVVMDRCERVVIVQARSVIGEFVRRIDLQTSATENYGLAISPDSSQMVVLHGDHTLSVYSLPGGEHIRTFGSAGLGKGQFSMPVKLCFSVAGNILVAERFNKRVQEVTLTGDHVRFIGVGLLNDSIWGIASNAELIVVGNSYILSCSHIEVFDAVTGACVREFNHYTDVPGRNECLSSYGIRFKPDNRQVVVVADSWGFGAQMGLVSVFTLAGEFVRCRGKREPMNVRDVEVADNGYIIVCDGWACRICVYSTDGSTLLRQWGGKGNADGKFMLPTALAMCDGQLYVLDNRRKCVQVFQ